MARRFIGFITVFAVSSVLVGSVFAQSTTATASQDLVIVIPRGESPVLDGTLGSDEWSGACQAEFSDGSELFLMHAEGYLYLGIRGKRSPVTSICVDRGDEVAVLHSSAALGTAVYQEGDSVWEMVQPFLWSCRDTTNNARAVTARTEFLDREGWVASNGRMGTSEEIEYQIAIPDGALRLAVSAIGAPDYGNVAVWPTAVEDDCVNAQLLTGPIPEQVQFSPETWAVTRVPPEQ